MSIWLSAAGGLARGSVVRRLQLLLNVRFKYTIGADSLIKPSSLMTSSHCPPVVDPAEGACGTRSLKPCPPASERARTTLAARTTLRVLVYRDTDRLRALAATARTSPAADPSTTLLAGSTRACPAPRVCTSRERGLAPSANASVRPSYSWTRLAAFFGETHTGLPCRMSRQAAQYMPPTVLRPFICTTSANACSYFFPCAACLSGRTKLV